MAAHRYWRVFMWASPNGAMALSEIQMRTSVGGANVMSGGTISAATTFGGFPASNMLDNNINTLWSASGVGTNWVMYDFGVGITPDIIEIAMTPRNDASFTQAPTSFVVQNSDDGTTWFSEWMVLGSAAYTQGVQKVFTKPTFGTTARYLGLSIDSTVSGGTTVIADLSLRAVSGGSTVNPRVGQTSSISLSNAAGPENAADGTTATVFSTQGGASPPLWWQVQFLSGTKTVVEVKITSRNDFNYAAQSPTAFDLQWSNDGSSWTTLQSFTSGAWTQNQTQTFAVTNTPVAASWWRINVTAVNGGGTNAFACSEITMAESTGGTNLFIATTMTAAAFSHADNRPAHAALDDLNTTNWQGGASQPLPVWWRQDMLSAQAFAELAMSATANNQSGALTAGQHPGSFTLMGSTDGINYATVKRFVASTWSFGQVQLFNVIPLVVTASATRMMMM